MKPLAAKIRMCMIYTHLLRKGAFVARLRAKQFLPACAMNRATACRGGSVCLNRLARLLSGESAGFTLLREAVS